MLNLRKVSGFELGTKLALNFALVILVGTLLGCASGPQKTEHIVYKRMQDERGLTSPDATRSPASEAESEKTKKKIGPIKPYEE